jgi:mannosyltransferase
VAILAAALALTQYWDLYLIAVVGAALLFRAVRAPERGERRAAARVFAATAIGSAAFLVWLPVFLDQVRHTGTPWGDPQFPWVILPRALIAFAGSEKDGEAFVLAFVLLVLMLLAMFGRATDERHIELDVHLRPAVRWEWAAAFGALFVGGTLSYIGGTTFQPRYAASAYVLFALVVAFGVVAFADRRMQVGVVAIVVVLGFAGAVRNTVTNRTQAGEVADVIAAESKPGDVVAYCPDQDGPAVSRLLRDVRGLRQLTFPDGARPERVNWSDYLDRIDRADPARFAKSVLDRAGTSTIWYVSTPGLLHLEGKCEAVARALDAARRPSDRVAGDANTFFEVDSLTEYRAP